MADFTALKSAIQTYIKQNGNEEITGEKLQEILLSVVTTLGDSAINDLVTALNDEVAARQNADGTLQQNITYEATARGNADTALGGRIDDEATARANGDTALSNRLGSTITAENTAADQIGAEAEARAAADTALQELIDGITNNIENGYVYAGIATPSSTPATGKVFYLALTAGTYTNFGNTEVSQGINILKFNGSAWLLDAFIGIDDELTADSNNLPKSGNVLENIIKNGSAFDISAHFASGGTLATYADLSAALAALNTLSASYKRGGMSIKFVRTSDNKYVQYRLMSDSFSTTETDWQGVDEKPTADSNNLVKSGGVAEMYGSYVENPEFVEIKLDNNNQIIEATFKDGTKLFPAGVNIHDKIDFDGAVTTVVDNPEFVAVWLDGNDRILLGVRSNADILFGYGVPSQIKAYIDEEIHKVSPEGVQEIIDFIGDYLGNTTLQELLDKKVDGVYVDNPEFVEVKTDNEDKIIEATKKDGTKYFGAGVENNTSEVYSTSNPEFIMAVLDVAHKIIEGIRRDGTKVIGGDLEIGGEVLFDKGVPQQLKDYIAENIPTGSGVSDIEYDDETGDIYATYNDESGVTDVYMDENGDIYVEQEIII